ncbi:membrane bound O-acyl transferase family-domain-containing protein [Pisolithus orientalis]|uniref:membrane bound O-acyl transferase family-domain-containing protein n=1 Tax=Pisolithus orientalis TaxID=936130 RepID=UPI00222593E9|nr:membrane bound O-acyl transferase family-domain-containing protein [Pisolithus orientalis]KAI6003208.1 membrane bound O-acyl transferase family-domain-containing protein [Pisolithus orientalis]
MTTEKVCPIGEDIAIYVLPIFAMQYFMGALVQLKNTALLRIALLPVVLWLAWRAVSALDFSCGNHEKAQANAIFVNSTFRNGVPASIPTAFWNAWDLLLNSRWRRLELPSFETNSRARFLVYAVARAIFCGLAFDAFTETVCTYSPNLGSWKGDSILDYSLPFVPRYLRALQILYLAVWLTYFALNWAYYSLAIVCIIVFRQRPSQWPPLFDRPWLSTSLSDFWGRRWHQMFRFPLVSCGGVPLAYLFGRPGGVLGTFMMSAIFHIIELRAVGRGSNIAVQVSFFALNGVGVLLERAWAKRTGRRLKGSVCGWIWTFSWMALLALPVVDEWARVGRFAVDRFPGGFKPTMALLSLVQLPPGVDNGFVLKCLCFGTSLPFLAYSLFTLS